jgi:hypothetical protein
MKAVFHGACENTVKSSVTLDFVKIKSSVTLELKGVHHTSAALPGMPGGQEEEEEEEDQGISLSQINPRRFIQREKEID